MSPASNDWHNAIAHIDADCFYVSCEMMRRPDLKGRPVCVLSSQGAFAIAKSYDAKAKGVTTGMAIRDARALVPDAVFLMPDFRFYGQLSQKMFAVLRRYSPDVEVCSIDEAFMDMNGLRTLWRKGFRQLGDEIREAVKREVGITVSVGVANTRTLAKIASESNKPDGTTIVPGRRIARFLADIDVLDIPGIGMSRQALLHKFDIRTAADFIRAGEPLIRRLLGRHGTVLWQELNGKVVQPLQLTPRLPKSVARTASMGQVSAERMLIAAHLSGHTHRLVADLTARGLLAEKINVFLTLESFERTEIGMRLECPSNSLKRITGTVRRAFMLLYRTGTLYRGCGVIATGIGRESTATYDLFGLMQSDQRQGDLMDAVNRINRKHGNRTITSAVTKLLEKQKKDLPRFRYPLLSAH